MKRILLCGLPGSGKTTHAKKLAERIGVCEVSVGNALREMAKEDSTLGHLVKAEMSKGDFVDDAIAAKVVRSQINSSGCENGFVVDGYPRSLGQLEMYDPEFNNIVFIDVPEDIAKARLLARGRLDDDPHVVEHRLKVYEEHTRPIIEYYQNLGLVKTIDGHGEMEDVYGRILEALEE